MKADWKISLEQTRSCLPGSDAAFRFDYALRHGSMKLGLYAPLGTDTQGPHKQDEIYIVANGSGEVVKNGEVLTFAPQDVIFVEAGATHRFQNFTEDFETWVLFWGPESGE